MSENNSFKTIVAKVLTNMRVGVQLTISILLLAAIVVWFSNEDS